MSGFARETQRKIDDEWKRISELRRQQDKEYQEALAKDMENMGIKSKPEPDTSPNHIKQLLLKVKFNHIQNGFIIPLTHCLQPHFVNQNGSIQEDLTEMVSDDEDEYSEVQYASTLYLNLEDTILLPHGIKHLIEINKIEIYIKISSDKTITLVFLRVLDTIGNVKSRIEDKEGISYNKQHLIFKGEELYDDTHTLSEYNIKKKSTLYLMVDKEIESEEEEEDRDDGWESPNISDNEKEYSSKPTPNPFGDSSTDEDEDEENIKWFEQREQDKLNELARLKEEGIIPVQLKIPADLAAVINKDSITVYATCESNCRALKIISPYPVPGISRIGGNTWTEVAENNTEDNLKDFFSEIERLNRHFTKKPSTTNTFSFEYDFSGYRLAKPCWKRLLKLYNDFNDTCVRTIDLNVVHLEWTLDERQKIKGDLMFWGNKLKKLYLKLMKTFFTSMYNAQDEEIETFKKTLNEDDLELFESHENGDRYKLEKLFEDKNTFVFQIPKMKMYIEKALNSIYNMLRGPIQRFEDTNVVGNAIYIHELNKIKRKLRKIYVDTKKNFEDWITNMLMPEVDRTLVVVNDLHDIFQKKGYFVNIFSKAYCEKINENNWSGIRIDGNRIQLEYLPGYEEMTREISLQCMKKNTSDIFVKWKNYEIVNGTKFDVTGTQTEKSMDRLYATDSIFKYQRL